MFYLYCRKCDRVVFNWKNCHCAKSKITRSIPSHFSWIKASKIKKLNHSSYVYDLVLRPLKDYDKGQKNED